MNFNEFRMPEMMSLSCTPDTARKIARCEYGREAIARLKEVEMLLPGSM